MKSQAELTHYAVVQLGYCVLGAAETLEAAEIQAAESLEAERDDDTGEERTPLQVAQDAPEYLRGQSRDGDLVWTRCTAALAEAVQLDSVVYADVDGGICLPDEVDD